MHPCPFPCCLVSVGRPFPLDLLRGKGDLLQHCGVGEGSCLQSPAHMAAQFFVVSFVLLEQAGNLDSSWQLSDLCNELRGDCLSEVTGSRPIVAFPHGLDGLVRVEGVCEPVNQLSDGLSDADAFPEVAVRCLVELCRWRSSGCACTSCRRSFTRFSGRPSAALVLALGSWLEAAGFG